MNPYQKISLLLSLLAFITFFACQQQPEVRQETSNNQLEIERIPDAKPRNVIFILSDDHRYDFMSFMNNYVPWLETPNLDRLAREGAHLENAFVSTSLCSPSRASILTGLYTHTHTVVDNNAPEPEGLVYFPRYLQEAGYETAFIGKWHMGDKGDQPRPGFDHWVSFRGQGDYYNPTLNIDGQRKTYNDSSYISTLLTDFAIDWMGQRDDEKPFFLYLSHKAVHGDFSPAKTDHYDYHGKPIGKPESYYITDPNHPQNREDVNYEGIPDWVKEQRYSWHGVDYAYHGKFNMDTIVWRYTEALKGMDREIGRVLDYLDEKGLAESTMVIYMGDNGFCFGEHGLIDKRHMYEASFRVPMLARCPEIIQPGTKVSKMVQNIDIGPTVMELAGLQTPNHMHGRSYVPLLRGEEVADWRDKVYYEYYWEYDFPQTPTMHGVRTDRYKYIRYHGLWDVNEFYNLESDPHEMNNLITKNSLQDTIRSMVVDLYDWMEATNGMQIPLKRTVKYPYGDYRYPNAF